MFILYAKLAASLLLAVVLLLIIWQRARIERLLARPGVPWLGTFWVVLRVIPFLIIYVWLDFMPQSDVLSYYYPIGLGAATGKLLYRDVYCPYSPFFGYYIAPFLWLWRSPKVIVLAMSLVELLAVWLTVREPLTPEDRPARLFRSLVYYLLPVSFVFCVMSGQEDVGLWLFTLLAGRAVARQRGGWAGFWFALGLLSTKAIFVLLGIPLFFMLRTWADRGRFVAVCAALGLPVLAFLYYKTGLLFIEQPLEEGTYLKAPNLRSVLAPWVGEGINRFQKIESYVGLLSAVGLTAYALYRRRLQNGYVANALFYILIMSWLTVVQHNAISNYAYLFMLPLLFVITDFADRRFMVGLVVFNVMAAVHSTFWWRTGQPFFYNFGQINTPVYWLDYVMEVALVGGFAFFAVRAMRQLQKISL
jgi:hypothetical protein